MTEGPEKMIATLREKPYRIRDERILGAMAKVPREEFLPEGWKHAAYDDRALPLGYEQTISQPFIVAAMLEMLQPRPGQRILEVGAGAGYQAAVLSHLVRHVFAVEIVEDLAGRARNNLEKLGISNVSVRHGDGRDAWLEKAPFDGIVVACAPRRVPEPLKAQLACGGRMVYPLGDCEQQNLYVMRREGDSWIEERKFGVRFVPMTKDMR